MSNLPPEPRKPPHTPRRPLDYASRSTDPNRPAGGVPYIGQLAIGCSTSIALIVLSAILGGYVSDGGMAPLVLFPVAMACALIMVSVIIRQRWRWRAAPLGVALGALIVVGIPLLALGLCYAVFSGIGR